MRSTIESEETHQISELTMDVSKDLQRRFGLKDHRLTDNNLFSYVAKCNNLLGPESDLDCFCVGEIIRFHQHVEEFVSDVELAIQRFGLKASIDFIFFIADDWSSQLDSLSLFGERFCFLFRSH
jgi:hypothetical protein